MDNDIFFTTISNPKDFRIGLLESSKDIIQVLKGMNSLMERRKEKEDKIESLTKHFDELNELLERMDTYMPDEAMNKIRELRPKPKPAKAENSEGKPKKARKKKKKKAVKKPEGEIDKLSQALHDIESKLQEV